MQKNTNCKIHLFGLSSAAQYVSKSIAVIFVCLRDGTNTRTGFLGECFMIAL